jgi:hypothetical protein
MAVFSARFGKFWRIGKLSGGQKIFLAGSQFLADFWRIWPILHGVIFVWRIWRFLVGLESLLAKINFLLLFLAFFGIFYLPVSQKYFFINYSQQKIIVLATPEIRPNLGTYEVTEIDANFVLEEEYFVSGMSARRCIDSCDWRAI